MKSTVVICGSYEPTCIKLHEALMNIDDAKIVIADDIPNRNFNLDDVREPKRIDLEAFHQNIRPIPKKRKRKR